MESISNDQDGKEAYIYFCEKLKFIENLNALHLEDKNKFFETIKYLFDDSFNFVTQTCVFNLNLKSNDVRTNTGWILDPVLGKLIQIIRNYNFKFKEWSSKDLEELFDLTHKFILYSLQDLTDSKRADVNKLFKKFFGKEIKEVDKLIYGEIKNCLEALENPKHTKRLLRHTQKLYCLMNILYFVLLRCKDDYRDELVKKLYDLTDDSNSELSKFIFQGILTVLSQNNWSSFKKYFWEYNYFSKTKDKIFWFPDNPDNIVAFNHTLKTNKISNFINKLKSYQLLLKNLIGKVDDKLDDSDVREFRKIFRLKDDGSIDEELLVELIKNLNLKENLLGINKCMYLYDLSEWRKRSKKIFINKGMSSSEKQKEEERLVLDNFLDNIREGYSFQISEIEKSERPDFVVNIEGKRIGIELTTYNTSKERQNSLSSNDGLKSINMQEASCAVREIIINKIEKYASFNSSNHIDELWLVIYSPSFFYKTSQGVFYDSFRNGADLLKEFVMDLSNIDTFKLIFIFDFRLFEKGFFMRNESSIFKK